MPGKPGEKRFCAVCGEEIPSGWMGMFIEDGIQKWVHYTAGMECRRALKMPMVTPLFLSPPPIRVMPVKGAE